MKIEKRIRIICIGVLLMGLMGCADVEDLELLGKGEVEEVKYIQPTNVCSNSYTIIRFKDNSSVSLMGMRSVPGGEIKVYRDWKAIGWQYRFEVIK